MYSLKLDTKSFKEFIKEHGKKMKDIAEESGISNSYISKIINKKTKISKTYALAFCKSISSEFEILDLFDNF